MQKLISWNVNGLRACMDKGFMDFSTALMRMRYVFRKLNCRKDSLSGIGKDTMLIGIMRRKKVTQAPLFFEEGAG